MGIIIPKKLSAMVEAYLNASNRDHEMGGYFFGHDDRFTGFLPIPNHAENTRNTYNLGRTRLFADHYARMLGQGIIADMHTHPNGTVPSEQDSRYVSGMSWKYHVIASDKGNEWEWFVVDSQLRGVNWLSSNIELEGYAEAMASETGLTYLGQIFLTSKGEVVGKPEAQRYITVDTDSYRLSQYVQKVRARSQWHDFTYAEAQRELGISSSRAKVAFKKLGLRP